MFGHRSFLMLGSDAADIKNLINGGYEILDCHFSFHQKTDHKGKATTKVAGGTINLLLSQLPSQSIIEWGLESRKYNKGMIVLLDNENVPIEKIYFERGACIQFEVNYTQSGTSYATTKLVIQAEKLIVGNGIEFDNEWIH